MRHRSPGKETLEKLLSLYYTRWLQRQKLGDTRLVDDYKQIVSVLERIVALDSGDQKSLKLLNYFKSLSLNVYLN